MGDWSISGMRQLPRKDVLLWQIFRSKVELRSTLNNTQQAYSSSLRVQMRAYEFKQNGTQFICLVFGFNHYLESNNRS